MKKKRRRKKPKYAIDLVGGPLDGGTFDPSMPDGSFTPYLEFEMESGSSYIYIPTLIDAELNIKYCVLLLIRNDEAQFTI